MVSLYRMVSNAGKIHNPLWRNVSTTEALKTCLQKSYLLSRQREGRNIGYLRAKNCNRWQQQKSENVSLLSSNIAVFLVHTKIKNIYLASSRLGKTPTLLVNNCYIYFEGIGMPSFGYFFIYLLHINTEFPLPGISWSGWVISSKSSNGTFDSPLCSSSSCVRLSEHEIVIMSSW